MKTKREEKIKDLLLLALHISNSLKDKCFQGAFPSADIKKLGKLAAEILVQDNVDLEDREEE